MSDGTTRGAPGAGRAGADRPAPAGGRDARGIETLEALRLQLWGELQASREELDACRVEADRLRERIAAFEREHRRVCDDYASLEEQVAELGNAAVVMERLHGTCDHAEVLAAVQDLVINVIGSEELAVFVLSADERALLPAQCFGVEARRLGPVALGEGFVGQVAAERRGWVVGDGPAPGDAPDLTACVPLTCADRLVGVLAIWRMLPHKPVLGEADRRALDLLARHAGTALHLTSLAARRGEQRGT